MAGACPEWGAPGGASCRDHFHALLLLESEIPGGPGNTTHFYAVGSYALQHPESMGYTAAALAGLRARLAERVAGRVTMEQVRRRVRRAADGAARVLRRPGGPVAGWRVADERRRRSGRGRRWGAGSGLGRDAAC